MSNELERLLAFTIAWGWVAAPSIPIAAAWCALHRSIKPGLEASIFLLLATISYCWILFGLFFRSALGPDYSSERSMIVLANIVAMAILALWAAVRGRDCKMRLIIVSLVTASVWFYVLAISSVV